MIKQRKLGGRSLDDGVFGRPPLSEMLEDVQKLLEEDEDGLPRRPPANGHHRISDIALEISDDEIVDEISGGALNANTLVNKIEDSGGKLAEWVVYAKNLVARYVKLRTYSNTLAALFAGDAICILKPEKSGDYVLVIYNVALAGEASSRPHLRACPFRQEHAATPIKAILVGLQSANTMPVGHLFFMLDGKVHGSAPSFPKLFVDDGGKVLPKTHSVVYVTTSEESERKTKCRVQGVGTLGAIQFMHTFSKGAICTKVKPRKHFAGTTTSSNVVGPFQRLDPADMAMRVPHCEKGSLYGKALLQVGGPVEGAPSVDEDPGPRGKDMVPFSWHALPTEFYEELFHDYNGIGAIDLAASDVTLPMAAIRERKTYLGHVPHR